MTKETIESRRRLAKKIVSMADDNGIQNLASAIITKAVNDYREGLRKYKKKLWKFDHGYLYPGEHTRADLYGYNYPNLYGPKHMVDPPKIVNDCEVFFESSYCQSLLSSFTDMSGPGIKKVIYDEVFGGDE